MPGDVKRTPVLADHDRIARSGSRRRKFRVDGFARADIKDDDVRRRRAAVIYSLRRAVRRSMCKPGGLRLSRTNRLKPLPCTLAPCCLIAARTAHVQVSFSGAVRRETKIS